MNSKKLLIVTQHFYPENFKINDLVIGLVEQNFEIDVLCGHPNYPHGNWYEGYDGKNNSIEMFHGATIYRAKEIPRKGNTSIRIFLNYVSWPFFASFKIRKLSKNYDAVICYNTSPVLMIWPAFIASKRSKCSLITYVLDLWPENLYSVLPLENKLLRSLIENLSNFLYTKSNKIIALSDGMKTKLATRLGNNKKYAVIPQYAENLYSEALCDHALVEKYKGYDVLLFTGSLTPAQNLEMAIKAVCNVRNNGYETLKLVIVGDGMSEEKLRELVETKGADEFIHFTGRIEPEDVPSYTNIADACLLSLSPSEDLSLTVPAKLPCYMAAGKPILASIDGAAKKIIENANCGLITAPTSQKEFEDMLIRFKNMNQKDRLELGKNGLDFYQQNYTLQKCLDSLIAEIK